MTLQRWASDSGPNYFASLAARFKHATPSSSGGTSCKLLQRPWSVWKLRARTSCGRCGNIFPPTSWSYQLAEQQGNKMQQFLSSLWSVLASCTGKRDTRKRRPQQLQDLKIGNEPSTSITSSPRTSCIILHVQLLKSTQHDEQTGPRGRWSATNNSTALSLLAEGVLAPGCDEKQS